MAIETSIRKSGCDLRTRGVTVVGVACLLLGAASMAGLGFSNPQRLRASPPRPVSPRPTPQPAPEPAPAQNAPDMQANFARSRVFGTSSLIRLDGVTYRVTARAVRNVGGIAIENVPISSWVNVEVQLTRADGRQIRTPVPTPEVIFSQNNEPTSVPVSPLVDLPMPRNTRTFVGVGNTAWADDVQLIGTLRFRTPRSGVVTTRVVVPLSVVFYPTPFAGG